MKKYLNPLFWVCVPIALVCWAFIVTMEQVDEFNDDIDAWWNKRSDDEQ